MTFKFNVKSLYSWGTVLLWMILIFFFSSQPAHDSNELSKGITRSIKEVVEKITPEEEVFTFGDFNHKVRKNAHFFIYLVLAILVLNSLKSNRVKGSKKILITFMICVLYAISDEIHQLFVPGRGAQIRDVMIDSTGAVVGMLLFKVIGIVKRK
jgi:VanZ family protein